MTGWRVGKRSEVTTNDLKGLGFMKEMSGQRLALGEMVKLDSKRLLIWHLLDL